MGFPHWFNMGPIWANSYGLNQKQPIKDPCMFCMYAGPIWGPSGLTHMGAHIGLTRLVRSKQPIWDPYMHVCWVFLSCFHEAPRFCFFIIDNFEM